ncbi:hypothetical protein [Paenibacillus lautus]|uniref:hypothetical protein n=1 Tax=Paenibacillus lautus TaxID=1401 RepID=UPI000FD81685|nr:hypothetical protein [Paenibacillus lautus]
MKKFKLVLLAISLILCSFAGVASADEAQGDESFGETIQQVDQMRENGATNEEVIQFLNSKGIEVLASDSVIVDNRGNEVSDISPQALDPSLRVLRNYITKDSGRYYAWVQVEKKATLPANATYEPYPASYDLVSINWDPKKFDYVANGVTNRNMWLADADQRNAGTILFNIYDNFDGENVSVVSGYAKLSAKGTGQTTTAAKYTHTYYVNKNTSTYSGTAKWSWGNPLDVGVSYSITTIQNETYWPTAATASVTL